jgi:hypothetical protein
MDAAILEQASRRAARRYTGSMPPPVPEHCPYTAFFCEENVWWLAQRLAGAGARAEDMDVIFLGNPYMSVLLLEQRAAAPGEPMIWDYHVILRLRDAQGCWIFDRDSRLPCPLPCDEYLAATFPPQARLRPDLRTWVRSIPAADYLARFHSDRGHMVGRIPSTAFPRHPPLGPPPGSPAVDLAQYWDFGRDLPGTVLSRGVSALCPPA